MSSAPRPRPTPGELAGRLRARYPDVLVARDEVTMVNQIDELLSSLAFVRDAERNRFPHIDCFAHLLPSAVHWRQHFGYLTPAAEKENPAAFTPKRKAVS